MALWYIYRHTEQPQEKEISWGGPNFLGGSFSNRDNVRAPIQFIKSTPAS